MKDVYVLHDIKSGKIVAAAVDWDRVSEESARFTADEQETLRIDNVDLFEEGD